MEQVMAEALIRAYFAGWIAADRDQILRTLHPDCVIVECYGPIYRGLARVGQWIDAWFGEGNTVDDWRITSWVLADAAAVEWAFTCTWRGERSTFEGASIVRFRDQKIAYLREYQTTQPLYEWEGERRAP